MKEEPDEAPNELQDAPQLCVVFGPWRRKKEILPSISEEGSGKEAGEEPQKSTAQATNSLLPYLDLVHIMPTHAAHETHGTPTAKAIPSALPVQYFRKLVANVQTFATTSQRNWQLLILHGIADGFGAGSDLEHLNLNNSTSSTSSNNLQRLEKLVWGDSVSPTFCFDFFFVLFYFILFYFDLVNFSL